MANKEIDEILDVYHFSTLMRMAGAAGLETTRADGKKLRKKELLAKMRNEFFTEARVRASVKRLDERERAVLNRLLLRGGSALTKSFRRELVRANLATEAPQPERPQRYYHYHSGVPYDRGAYAGDPERRDSGVFEDVIARLTYHGLVFSRGDIGNSVGQPFKIQFHPVRVIYVPQVIRQYLPQPESIPSALSGWQPERVEAGAPEILLRDLYLYWDFVRRNEVTFIQSGFVGKRWLKAINETLLIPDPLLGSARQEDGTGRLYALRQLLEACKLVRQDRGTLRPVGKDALDIPSFWSLPPLEQQSACLKVWPKVQGSGSLESEDSLQGVYYANARHVILAALQTMPAGVWLEPAELLDQVQIQDADFLFFERSRIEAYEGSYYSSSYYDYYGKTSTLIAKFDQLETQFVNHCLAGFLRQVGVVDLGYDGDELQGFRITPRGAVMLGIQPPESLAAQDEPAPDTGRLVVQPNFQLMALGPVSLALLARLDLFADRERADRGAFEYRLTRESVYRAQQLGMDAADVLHTLDQDGDTDIPQNVRRTLDEWATHHERIVFRTGASLLQAANAELLSTLMDDPDTGQHLARSVTPEVALLRQGKRLTSVLVERGLLPAISGPNPEAADHSVTVHKDGTIRPIHAVPSLHLRGRLARLAQHKADGTWQLTPDSIRRAGGSRGKVLNILEELTELHRGPFPKQLTEQVKAWGGYYGRAAVDTLTLIEFRDQTVLGELRRHPDLRAYLTPFPAGDRALAVVPADKLTEVKEILSRLGVQVKDGLA